MGKNEQLHSGEKSKQNKQRMLKHPTTSIVKEKKLTFIEWQHNHGITSFIL
jgi:hypothetical protein